MKTFVCLLRGVNVTGHNKLPMAELRASLEAAGMRGARTYIQSGNVALRSNASAKSLKSRIEKLLAADFGLHPDVLVLTSAELATAIDSCPYQEEAEADPRRVHLHFLGGTPERAALQAAKAVAGSDHFELVGRVLYLHTPDGYGKSKLAERLLDKKKLGVTITARNYRTALAVQALAAALG